jgi:hypothetical protein
VLQRSPATWPAVSVAQVRAPVAIRTQAAAADGVAFQAVWLAPGERRSGRWATRSGFMVSACAGWVAQPGLG